MEAIRSDESSKSRSGVFVILGGELRKPLQQGLELGHPDREPFHRNRLDSGVAQRIAHKSVPKIVVVQRNVRNRRKFRSKPARGAMYCAVYAYSLQAIGERLTLSVCTKR